MKVQRRKSPENSRDELEFWWNFCSEASSYFNNNKTFHYLCKHCAKLFNYFLLHWLKVQENLNFKWGKSFKSRYECHWFNCENSSQTQLSHYYAIFAPWRVIQNFTCRLFELRVRPSFCLKTRRHCVYSKKHDSWFLLNKVFIYRYPDWSWHLWNLPSV